jgi:hypothetical protein
MRWEKSHWDILPDTNCLNYKVFAYRLRASNSKFIHAERITVKEGDRHQQISTAGNHHNLSSTFAVNEGHVYLLPQDGNLAHPHHPGRDPERRLACNYHRTITITDGVFLSQTT